MTAAGPAGEISLGPERPADWLRLSWPQLGWLLRLAELLAVLALVALGRPRHHLGLLEVLLAVAATAWIVWLCVRPWRSEAPARGWAALAPMLVIAAVSGLATMIEGGGDAAILAGVVAIQAGAALEAGTALSVPLAGVAGLALGGLVLTGPSYGILGRLPAGAHVAIYAAAFGGATLTGVVRGLRRAQHRQARLLLAQEQQTRAERERAAALAERARIAREIHDILAHSLADLSIQLEVADALLSGEEDVAGALDRVRHAHRLAAEGLEETRQAIHALRSDAPPLLDALEVMVGAYRRHGGEASLEVEGAPRPLTAAAGLALLRAAQEALVNARKHAAGRPVGVHLCYEPDRVALAVVDGATREAPGTPAGTGGYGLAGMRERLRLAGGSLVAGPVPGGWAVHAEVPE
ncbi:sensor histidine kinase [Actinomadura sp. DC4]|uniref:sensor histidine kinase n=1 Tax=Actinomadura sp. DC4 TaxID=3055069 RepID=UPI0025B0B68F|nr:sensor histidine kinase [Actinomadura sp. DC4]MDN3360094.1 histidine kinase [Actinomadura sp. DC4]